MIKVTDYIVKRLVEFGTKDVFMISGGGAMHLNDSVGKCPDLNYYCNHHEQACAIAAEGYARTVQKMAVVIVTSGPGGLNTLTGVLGQWTDSVPVLYISGQVKYETTIASCSDIPLRQLGDQEVDITSVVRPLTKYAVSITSPETICYHLEKAVHLATSGRPGPVWIDIPLNIQGMMINENELVPYHKSDDEIVYDPHQLHRSITDLIDLIQKASRPVIIAGHGIRISGTRSLFLDIIEKLNIPILSTFNGIDIIPSDHPLYIGRIGTVGDRAGNFALQNADLVLCLGSRNNIRQISYNWDYYASNAIKIIVDIDAAELSKPTLLPEMKINYDLKVFLPVLKEAIGEERFAFRSWVLWCKERKQKYPVVLSEYQHEKNYVNPYYFIQALTSLMQEKDILVAGNGTACVASFQAAIVKDGQRIFWNSGCASMGYDLPAAIGSAIASKRSVVCLAGDGSIQMNLQELQTVAHYKLPIKLFYLNNQGYSSIKQTQDHFFDGRRVACDEKSGVSFPDIEKIAEAYRITFMRLNDHQDINAHIQKFLQVSEAIICEVMVNPDFQFAPKLSSEKSPDGRIVSKSLEDMYPFLPREEFENNLIKINN